MHRRAPRRSEQATQDTLTANMGGLLSNSGGQSTEPDPATGLSPRDKHLVTSSWNLAKKNVKETGLHLFQLLFEDPAVRDLFHFAKGKPWNEELTSEPRLLAHVNSVMYAITALVDNIEHTPVLDAMLRKTADSHMARSITIKEFEILGPLVLKTLATKLGPRVMTPEATEAWIKVFDVILKIIGDQMNEKSQGSP